MKALRIIIFVIIMGTVSAALLVGVNAFTMPLIVKNEELKLKSSILDVFDIAYDKGNIINVFDQNVNTQEEDNYTFYTTQDGKTAFKFYGSGLWGPLEGIISLENDLKTIYKIKITHQ